MGRSIGALRAQTGYCLKQNCHTEPIPQVLDSNPFESSAEICVMTIQLSPFTVRVVNRSACPYVYYLGLLLLLMCGSCSRCSHSEPSQTSSSSAPPIPSQLLARAGRLAPILAHNSPECLPCALSNCAQGVDHCLQIPGVASAGSAQGRAKSDLCAETLDCAIKSRCVGSGSGRFCYCGSGIGTECMSPKANGACKAKLEASLETKDPQEIALSYGDPQRGGGSAMQLVQCLINARCDRCF